MSLLQGPTPAQMEAIRDQLGEDTDRLLHNVQLFQKWIACQAHLPQDYENNMLPVFLRGCKHDLERAKKKFEMYFIARTKIPELFGDREPTTELMENYTKMIKIAPLRKLTPDGCRVTITKVAFCDENIFDMQDCLRYIYMVGDLRVAQETPIAGDVFVYDFKNVKAAYLAKYLSPLLRKALAAAQEAYPQRLYKLHLLNLPSFAEKILNVTMSFLKEKVRHRLIVHNSVDGLLKYLPSDILPLEYGGNAGKFDDLVDEWASYIVQNKKWFQQQDNVKAEGPIPETVSYTQFDDIIGLEGSFRKLELD